jgi:hypothetical protein
MPSHGAVSHREALRDHLAASGHPRQVMAGMGVVAREPVGARLPDAMLLVGQHGPIGRPGIGLIPPSGPFSSFREPAEGGSITTTDDLGDTSPWTTVQRFPAPALVFF